MVNIIHHAALDTMQGQSMVTGKKTVFLCTVLFSKPRKASNTRQSDYQKNKFFLSLDQPTIRIELMTSFLQSKRSTN